MRGASSLFLVFLVALLVVHYVQGNGTGTWSVSVERFTELSKHIVEDVIYFDAKNTEKTAQSSFLFALPSENLAHFNVYQPRSSSKDNHDESRKIKTKFVKKETRHGITYDVIEASLMAPVEANRKVFVKVDARYVHLLVPRPSSVTQFILQSVMYHGNHFIALPYATTSQITKVTGHQLIGHSNHQKPSSTEGDTTAVFGPYQNVPEWAYSESMVQTYNPSDFIVVDNLIREIEISHWGNIAVEESYQLHHAGATLEGSFSRLDFMMGGKGNSVSQLNQHLPKGAFDVYYRDIIGNISSSNVFPHEESVKLEIRPRFVLFGGWKDEFKTGYNLASPRYLSVEDSEYVLSIPFVNVFESSVVDEAEIRVILPEGAYDVSISSEISITEPVFSERQTYLDTSGRVVVAVRAKNLVLEHSDYPLVVRYKYPASSLIREPLFLIGAYAALFLVIILSNHVNVNLHDVSGGNVKSDKALEMATEYLKLMRSREANYEEKEGGSLPKKLKKYNMDMNTSYSATQGIIAKIGPEDAALGRKIQTIEELSKQKTNAFRRFLSAKSQPKVSEKMQNEYATASAALSTELSSLRSYLHE